MQRARLPQTVSEMKIPTLAAAKRERKENWPGNYAAHKIWYEINLKASVVLRK